MGGYSNPLTGSGWNQSPMPQTNPIQSFTDPTSMFGGPQGGWGNPGGYSDPQGSKEVNRNMGLTNIVAGQMKNQLAPQWAKLMGQYGGNAGNFFQQLMNLGSPYYKQKQQEAFTQGVGQNQNASAQAQQQLRSQGYGSTPSGANAAMIGGMNQQGAQNLSEQYLQNLFQNEQMQMGGAQGLTSLAQLFNPNQLLSGTSVGANIQDPASFAQDFNQITSGIGAMLGGGGQLAAGASGKKGG